MKLRHLLGSVALPALALAMAAPVYAQSTGTDTVEETIIVTGRAASTAGLIKKETVTKTRSTVDSKYLQTQPAGQTVAQSINLLPGVNFVNSDPYGSSGGNIRLRSFDGNRISLTADGMPLNDSGNYAIFTNQQFDSEIVDRITVAVGTTDVDSPTASATGGTINIATRKPNDEFGVQLTGSVGEHNYRRIFLGIDTGEVDDSGAAAFFTGSYQKYDKFKGPGTLEKKQFNAKLYERLGDRGDFISLAVHYNENRNAFYRNLSQFIPPAVAAGLGAAPTIGQIGFYGNTYDNLDVCTRDAPTPGVIDNENATPFGTGGGAFMVANDNPANTASCTNFFGIRINPSNTGNVRIQSSFAITDSLRLTVDPSFQYVLANGGGTTTIAETDGRLRGRNAAGTAFAAAGVDVNGDGDIVDNNIRFYTPNNTNTYRYGVTGSLIWDINDNNTLRVAYTIDYARHRQTGEWGYMDAAGNPENVFAGREGRVLSTADGSFIRGRDRFSIASLNQFAISYNGSFYDGRLKIAAGVRVPYFKRELNQYCYSQDGTSNVRCTTEPESAVLANGNVTLLSQGATQFIRPYSAEKKYDDILPNLGISYEIAENNIIYASFAQGLSAPRTDNLYTPKRNAVTGAIDLTGVDPEKTNSFDLGYRFQGEMVTASTAIWMTKYENRIVNSFDDVLGIFIDRNVGKVDLWGVDAEIGITPTEGLSIYASASYINSELQENVPITATTFLPTKGKVLVETPEWTAGLRVQYKVNGFTFGVQGKYVGDRFATDVNDEISPSYTIVDADIRYDFDIAGMDGTYIQVNVVNLFDEDYLGNISTTNNALNTALIGGGALRAGSAPLYSVGAPRTFQASIGFRF